MALKNFRRDLTRARTKLVSRSSRFGSLFQLASRANSSHIFRIRHQLECSVMNAICVNRDLIADGIGFECVCEEGYNESDGLCSDQDECEIGDIQCSHVTQCVNTEGSYFCSCNAGFTADAECIPCIAEHILGMVEDHSVCVGESDGNCCNNIDECALATHDCPTECHDTNGGYYCGKQHKIHTLS